MDNDISRLAELLRQNGDKISNNSCKFTLTTDLLNYLNSSFNLIVERRESFTTSFHVLNNTNEANQKFRDLHFLYDFVQLTKSLKLARNNGNAQVEFTDISKFKELCFLEIHKVDVNTIIGINLVCMKLQYLICVRCINKLSDILEFCGADKTEGLMWCELKDATFTHNNLREIDSSLKYVPWLNTLDLSNNLIDDADSLSCLLNLKYLNLSYNRLTKVPLFNGQICKRLQVLVLHNNFIDSIQDIHKLVNLEQLNLMENCLIEHDLLIPLSYLAALQFLNLKNNPLSYHPQHRIRTVRYLHKNTASVKFLLDNEGLSKTEQQSISSLHPKILNIETSSGNNSIDTSDIADRSVRVRQAVIADDILDTLESSLPIYPIPMRSPEIVDSKEQMTSMYKNYIKILYEKKGVGTKEQLKVTPKDIFIESHQQPMSSTPLGEIILNTIEDSIKVDCSATDNTSNYVTASETINNDDTFQEEVINDVYENKQTEIEEEQNSELSEDEELYSGESNIFMATIKGGNDIIVIVTQTHITEKDQINMKSLGRFTLDSMSICEMIMEMDMQYIHLEFDTVRINSSRYYFVEGEEERNRLYEKLRYIIDNRPPKQISNLFTCMKCSTQFGLEDPKTLHKEETVCPVCGSNLVFEEDRS